MQDLLLLDVIPLPMVDVYYDIDANSILDTTALVVITNEGIAYRKLSLITGCI